MPIAPISSNLQQLEPQIDGLIPTRGTPLYAVTGQSFDQMVAQYDPTRINAVVLLTDGRNDDGEPSDDDQQLQDVLADLNRQSQGENGLPVRLFTIGYGGDADLGVLRADGRGHQRRQLRRQRPEEHHQGLHRRGEQLLTMARRSLRDRFLTPQVARAITSPGGILLAGGRRVGRRRRRAAGRRRRRHRRGRLGRPGGRRHPPRPRRRPASTPGRLREPWRSFVKEAEQAQQQFTRARQRAGKGPLHDRLAEIDERIVAGVQECWRVAQAGNDLSIARSEIDVARHHPAAGQPSIRRPPPCAGSAAAGTLEALDAQLAAAARMDRVIAEVTDRLRLLDARLDEAVTRAIELSVRADNPDELSGLGDDIDTLVGDMESLRQGLDEVDATSAGRGGVPVAAAPRPPAVAAGPSPRRPVPAARRPTRRPSRPPSRRLLPRSSASAAAARAMSGPGDDPSGAADPTPVLPDDPSIGGAERAVADAAEGEPSRPRPRRPSARTDVELARAGRPDDRRGRRRPSRGGLLRSSAVVGVGTGLSRLTGLLRVLALFYALQFTSLTDAYNLANTAPNIDLRAAARRGAVGHADPGLRRRPPARRRRRRSTPSSR